MKLKLISMAMGILLANCEGCKDEPQPMTELEKLPAATQEGKNTFGCLVDGKAWVPGSSVDAYAFYQEGVLVITALNKAVNEGVSIAIHDTALSEREYPLSEHLDQFSNWANFGDENNCGFETNSEHNGVAVSTHLDQRPGKWIISGTFEFEIYSTACQKKAKVTDGRFDLHYAP